MSPFPLSPHQRTRWTAAPGARMLLLLALVMPGCGGQGAEEDHAHGPDGEHLDEASAATPREGGVVTLWTDSTELFMEHPALIVGAPDRFAVHFTDVTDFQPLRTGRVTFRFVPRDGGSPVVVTQDAPRSPGIYGPAPDFSRPGVYDLSIFVESPQAKDSITVPGLRVYARAADAPPAEEETETGIAFLKEQQWKTAGFRMERAVEGTVATT
ncbi:MAG: hypothetical protein M3373_14510, partial [Gemmatimonadota bacterium]|nr:hypothetical protein [Gemmatimonadota bacterium]